MNQQTEDEHLEARVAHLEKDMIAIKAHLEATLPTLATKADLETVRTEVHRIGMIIIMWNVGTIIATAGIVFAILRFHSPQL
jgi:hypothetical protein